MPIIIGSARISENGTINGKKGDQTGNEVAQEKYYLHRQDWRGMRCIYPDRALMMSYDMASMCNNNNFGYSQSDRYSGLYEAKKVGYDTAKVNTPCNIDCTTGLRICLAYAGYEVEDFYTVTEYDTIMATGDFIDITDQFDHSTGEGLCSGDILVTNGKGHTVIVTNGKDPFVIAPENKIDIYPVNDGEQAIYRIYNPNSGEHFLTPSVEEVNALLTLGWQSEGIAFIELKESENPVFRMYSGLHMFVNTISELHALVENKWTFEGIAFHSGGDIPVYRILNPNSGDHLFTVSEEEKNNLKSNGWIVEGIAFFALRDK